MQFTKMHGAGNDYVYVDCFAQPEPEDPAELARLISDRHTGIGSDGLILIGPSPIADARMRMFNADGSEAGMCGNGLRCVAKYVYDRRHTKQPALAIESGGRVVQLHVERSAGPVSQVQVDLGEPEFDPAQIPTTLAGKPVVNAPLKVAGRKLAITALSVGNPHAVVFVPEATDALVAKLGPAIERNAHFPERVNVHFVEVRSPGELRQRTWERGSGETLACGSGAAAACVAGVLAGHCDRRVDIYMTGGKLAVHWNRADNHVYLTGPAVEVFSGEWSHAA